MTSKMKMLTIVGARPQFVKVGPVSRAVRVLSEKGGVNIEDVLVHTGQHYDHNMSQVFFDDLGISPPKHFLKIGSGPQGAQTGEMLARCEEVIVAEQPDVVLVYGDTNSTIAGALAAAKLHVPIAHVEAGLRSFNRRMPEEVNRVLTDHVSEILFAPTDTAVKNLATEGIFKGVHNLGDVMYDAVMQHLAMAQQKSTVIRDHRLESKSYFLATVHRAENTNDANRLAEILRALEELAQTSTIVWPVHPRTRKRMEELDLLPKSERLQLIEPVPYLDMLLLTSHAALVLTDSGGLQKEAMWLRVPCVTMRDETEWVETVESGWNRLAGADSKLIVASAREMLTRPPANSAGEEHAGASMRLVQVLADVYAR